jgi:hypothetical protein
LITGITMSVTSPDHEAAQQEVQAPPRRLSDYLENPIVAVVAILAIAATAGWLYLIAIGVLAITRFLFD